MKNKIFYTLLIVATFLMGCSNSFVYTSAKNLADCSEKGGSWYKNKCWKEFDDDGISISDVDSLANEQMKVLKDFIITIDNQRHPLVAFMPVDEGNKVYLITVYGSKDNYWSIIILTDNDALEKESFESVALLFKGNALNDDSEENPTMTGKASVNVVDIDKFEFEVEGDMNNGGESKLKKFKYKINETLIGIGNSHLEIKENEAFLSGELGTKTYVQIRDMIKNHPEVKTIIMTKISGSVNDAFNMHTGRLVNENGITTKVLADSDIASGGVDLFCAGKKRIVEKGAKIGIHSWCCVNDLTAIEIHKDHPSHKYQLAFFTMALGPEKGPDFYFHTLEAAPFDDVHYMSDDDIKKWKVATEFIDK